MSQLNALIDDIANDPLHKSVFIALAVALNVLLVVAGEWDWICYLVAASAVLGFRDHSIIRLYLALSAVFACFVMLAMICAVSFVAVYLPIG